MKQHSEFWYANRTSGENAEISIFDTPIKDFTRNNYITIMPASSRGYAEVMKYGETLFDTWTVIANYNYFKDKFEVGDVFYVDGELPLTEIEELYGNGCSANAVVKSVVYVDKTIQISLVRNQERVEK